MNILVVGDGSIGERHLKNLLKIKGVRCAVCEADKPKLELLMKDHTIDDVLKRFMCLFSMLLLFALLPEIEVFKDRQTGWDKISIPPIDRDGIFLVQAEHFVRAVKTQSKGHDHLGGSQANSRRVPLGKEIL